MVVPALFPHTAPQQPDRLQGVLFAEFHLGETEDVLEVSDNGMVTGWCTPETRIPRVGPTSAASRRDRETWAWDAEVPQGAGFRSLSGRAKQLDATETTPHRELPARA